MVHHHAAMGPDRWVVLMMVDWLHTSRAVPRSVNGTATTAQTCTLERGHRSKIEVSPRVNIP